MCGKYKKSYVSFGLIAARKNYSCRCNEPLFPFRPPSETRVNCASCQEQYNQLGRHLSQETKSPYTLLMVERRNTNAFTDIVQDNYRDVDTVVLLNELTCPERARLMNWNFSCIWDSLFVAGSEKKSHTSTDFLKCERIYNRRRSLLTSLLQEPTLIDKHHLFAEYEFPKGRKQQGESALQTALREFAEETGYLQSEIKILDYKNMIKEEFTGSDHKHYIRIYYLAVIETSRRPSFNRFSPHQAGEIQNLVYVDSATAKKLIREQDVEKKNCLDAAINLFRENHDIVIM